MSVTIGTVEGARKVIEYRAGTMREGVSEIGRGGTRTVYGVDSEPEVVYKVEHHSEPGKLSRYNRREVLTLEAAQRLGHPAVADATCWYVDGHLVLSMPRMSSRGTEDDANDLASATYAWQGRLAKTYKGLVDNLVADLFSANCATIGGRPVIIDAN